MSRTLMAACPAILLPAPIAGAFETVRDGCYLRAYSDDHLAAHPAQSVREMRLFIDADHPTLEGQPPSDMFVGVTVQAIFADQGLGVRPDRNAHGRPVVPGAVYLQPCFMCLEPAFDGAPGPSDVSCFLDRDGGTIGLTQAGPDEIHLRTRSFTLHTVDRVIRREGGGRESGMDPHRPDDVCLAREAAEPFRDGSPVLFRLFRRPAAECAFADLTD
jgi:hypothetical protein